MILLLGAGGRGLGYVNWVCGEFFWGGLWVQAGEGTRNWHVLSVARVLFFDLEMIEHLFAINLIEALHCRGGINKHTDMNRQNERGGRRKVPRTAPENDQSAQTGSLRRRKVPRTAPEK